MSKIKQARELTPEQQESHSAIVKAIFALVQMIVSFFTSKKKSDKSNL